MKRCQIGVGGRHALDNAHSIMADCYGTLGALMLEVERLRRAAQEDAQSGRAANSTPTEENERLRNALAELVALYKANEYASPIDEANIRDSSSREQEAWEAAKCALKA